MPLEPEKSRANYVNVTKLFISSKDKDENYTDPYTYEVRLDQEIQYVVGMEITGYNFPSEIAPTFISQGKKTRGTDKLDFQLQAGALVKNFTATWPEKSYSYQNLTVPYLSYVLVLGQILNIAIENDPDFGVGGANEAIFSSVADPNELSSVSVSGTGVTGFAYLFATGSNKDNSCFNAMGYNQVDTAFALEQKSPTRTNLKPFRYLDINIKQAAEFTPLKRIYTMDNIYYGTVRNDPSVSRTRLLSSQPIRKLRKLNIEIRLEGGIIPPNLTGLEHDLTITVFNIANEQVVPGWVSQVFVL
jgi:hypothetical protein